MAGPKSKDLFDNSVMTFGEHLEELRTRLIKSIYGLVIAMVFTMLFGEQIILFLREPIDAALERAARRSVAKKLNVTDDVKGYSFWETLGLVPPSTPPADPEQEKPGADRTITMEIPAYAIAEQLHKLAPEAYPEPPETNKEQIMTVDVSSDAFVDLRTRIKKINEPVTLNVQEAFVTYMKVAFISGFIVASPWIFFQMWLFVAAGLYQHEQKYVYTYLPISIGLFFGGAAFCFYAVFPTVLDFLLGFNERMGIAPQIRISEYISFAVLLPVVFGVSFQLPLVMLFLNKVSILQVKDYREKRRMAILVIAIVSMVLTPTADPMTMFLMMAPLLCLYEVGIYLCQWTAAKSPFESPAAT